jgi:hypothetical protein
MFKDCKVCVKCAECGSNRHATAMHIYRKSEQSDQKTESEKSNVNGGLGLPVDGGEKDSSKENVSSKCTSVCGDQFSGKSCAKTVLV